MVTYCGVGAGAGISVGRGVFVFITAEGAIVPFLAPGSTPVVFPTGNAGAYGMERTTPASIIINNANAPAVTEKYCLSLLFLRIYGGMRSGTLESRTSLRERLSTLTRIWFSSFRLLTIP